MNMKICIKAGIESVSLMHDANAIRNQLIASWLDSIRGTRDSQSSPVYSTGGGRPLVQFAPRSIAQYYWRKLSSLKTLEIVSSMGNWCNAGPKGLWFAYYADNRDAWIKTTVMLNKNYSHSVEQELHLCWIETTVFSCFLTSVELKLQIILQLKSVFLMILPTFT